MDSDRSSIRSIRDSADGAKQLIDNLLLEQAARAEGHSVDQYLSRNVESLAVSTAEVDQAFERSRFSFRACSRQKPSTASGALWRTTGATKRSIPYWENCDGRRVLPTTWSRKAWRCWTSRRRKAHRSVRRAHPLLSWSFPISHVPTAGPHNRRCVESWRDGRAVYGWYFGISPWSSTPKRYRGHALRCAPSGRPASGRCTTASSPPLDLRSGSTGFSSAVVQNLRASPAPRRSAPTRRRHRASRARRSSGALPTRGRSREYPVKYFGS